MPNTRKIFATFAPLALALGIALPSAAHADATPECNNGALINSTECGTNSSANAFATAVGQGSEAIGEGGTAVGYSSAASGYASTAFGTYSEAQGRNSVAIGEISTALGENAIAIGEHSNAVSLDTSAIGQFSGAAGEGSTAIGAKSGAGGGGASFSTALGAFAKASASNSVALGAASIADRADSVSVGSVAAPRQIVNVAAGTQATDAVNVGQMGAADAALQSQITINTSSITGVQSVNVTQSAQIGALSTQVSSIGTNISGLQSDIDSLYDLSRQDRRDTRQGIASAISMGNAPMPSQPGRVSYAVNGALFRGEKAVGGSMMYRLNTGAPMAIGAGFSYAGNKNNGMRVGIAGEF